MQTLYAASERPVVRKKVFQPTVTHRRVLQCLATHYFLDVTQILRLAGYAAGSITKLRASCKDLCDHGYVYRRAQTRETMRGSVKALYFLAPKGVKELAANGIPTTPHLTPGEIAALKPLHLEHTRLVNDTLIQLHRLCLAHPTAFTLERVLHERDLKRTAPRLTLPDGSTTRYAPDGFATVRLHRPDGDKRRHLTFEIDRGTMKRTGSASWQTKLARLVAWLTGPYPELFGTRAATIAIVATAGDAHAARLKRWLEQTLRDDLGRQDLGPSLIITSAEPAALTPEALFTEPRWRRCFSETPEPLLSGVLP